jgi:hypothetical protein
MRGVIFEGSPLLVCWRESEQRDVECDSEVQLSCLGHVVDLGNRPGDRVCRVNGHQIDPLPEHRQLALEQVDLVDSPLASTFRTLSRLFKAFSYEASNSFRNDHDRKPHNHRMPNER